MKYEMRLVGGVEPDIIERKMKNVYSTSDITTAVRDFFAQAINVTNVVSVRVTDIGKYIIETAVALTEEIIEMMRNMIHSKFHTRASIDIIPLGT